MTLKEEVEILRGEPILVFDGDLTDIPCIEESDSEKLCKHPVVSVHMMSISKYTGLRPGDKLYEEKLMAEKGLITTPNNLIHIGKKH